MLRAKRTKGGGELLYGSFRAAVKGRSRRRRKTESACMILMEVWGLPSFFYHQLQDAEADANGMLYYFPQRVSYQFWIEQMRGIGIRRDRQQQQQWTDAC